MKQQTIVREAWRLYYRAFRIRRRETALAAEDMMLTGTGYLRMDADGTCKRIAPQNITVRNDRRV